MNPYEKLDFKLSRKDLVKAIVESVAHAKSIGEKIKIYRFGFFRLQFVPSRLTEGYSLHIWSPKLFDTKDEAPHNHNSFMQSRVLLGSITNNFWGAQLKDPKGLWRPTETICTDTLCEDRPADYLVSFPLLEKKTYGPTSPNGDYYEMPHGAFHSTNFKPGTITLIHKSDIDPDEEIINLLPADQTPRTEQFDITSYSQKEAWEEVEDAMRRLEDSL